MIIASGRAYDTLPKEITSIPGIEYAISSNGASVWYKGECIRRIVLKEEAVSDLLAVYGRAKEEFFCRHGSIC